jgi:uncharacterized protein (DUF58 family)
VSQKSQLINNISRFGLDSLIGKALLTVRGTNVQAGERISGKTGYSPVIMDYKYYEKGDSVKDIDWKLSARTEKLFVKLREGHRQTDFIIVIDGSASMRTSYNGSISKFITGLTLAYIIGRVGFKSRDRIFVSYAGEKYRAFSENSLLSILLDIESGDPENNFWQNDIEASANVFILSDFFIEIDSLHQFLKKLIHRTKNLFMISIHDKFEQEFDFNGRYKFLDPESDAAMLTETKKISGNYIHNYAGHYHEVLKTGKLFGAKLGKISTEEDPYHAFVRAVS